MWIRLFSGAIAASLLLATTNGANIPPMARRQADPSGSISLTPSATSNATYYPPATTQGFQTPTSSPTTDAGLGSFQLVDFAAGGSRGCHVTANTRILGCNAPNPVICNSYCVDLNGRRSVGWCEGVVTVDFPPTPDAPTYIHYSAQNETYTGCTAPGKSSGSSCINDQEGQGTFGTVDFVGKWCVMDITQNQKSDSSKPASSTAAQYGYAISVYDGDTTSKASDSKNGRNLIAATKAGNVVYGAAKSPFVVDFDGVNKLPGSVTITSGNVDSDPYTISYQNPYLAGDLSFPGTETFNAYDTTHQCSLANVSPNGGKGNTWGFDGGNRKNTCGFPC